jgi:hypothetical protein
MMPGLFFFFFLLSPGYTFHSSWHFAGASLPHLLWLGQRFGAFFAESELDSTRYFLGGYTYVIVSAFLERDRKEE